MVFFQVPRLIFEAGSAERIGDECRKLNAKRVMVVTDKGLIRAGLLEQIEGSLAAAGLDTVIYDGVVANPRAGDVNRGGEIYRQEKCDLVIGFGGGSSLDTARGIAVLATNAPPISQYMQYGGRPFPNPPAQFIAIPTTSGTGSEVSIVSVIVDEKLGRKIVIYGQNLAPALAILDPKLTLGLPPQITANTGADALSHAIEAYTSTAASPFTDIFSLQALELLFGNLREAFANSGNLEARSSMMLGSTMAGIAMAQAGIALVHPLAHALGVMYDLPHGLLCGLFLPPVMEFNIISNPTKFKKIAEAFGLKVDGLTEIDAGRKAVDALKELLRDVKVPLRLVELGVHRQRFDDIVEQVMREKFALAWNPRQASREDVMKILETSF